MKKRKQKLFAALIVTLTIVVNTFSGIDLKTAQAADRSTISGILICANCRNDGFVIKHTVGCCLMSSCSISGYGIFVPQKDKTYKFYAFDADGTTKAYELLKKLKEEGTTDYISVNVTGTVDATPGEYTYKDGALTKTVAYDGRISNLSLEYDGTHESYTKNTISLSEADVSIADIADQLYTGNSTKPAVTVTDRGYILNESEDYTVSYKANTNAGLATVTIKGVGAYYKDTLTKTFSIITKEYAEPTGYVEENSSWSYVYFGSYPQTEITGAGLTGRITGANYDINKDATVDGIKYHRIAKTDVTDSSNYEWAEGEYRYFKYEPIKWKVLKVGDSEFLLQAAQILDVKVYQGTDTNTSWETSSLRTWLNSSFLNSAFTSAEQAVINTSAVTNNTVNSKGINGGDDTKDQVFILSSDELLNNAYGYSAGETYYSNTRKVKATAYAQAQGADISEYYSTAYYWLRSPAIDNLTAGIIIPSGAITYTYTKQNRVSYTRNGVVPTIRIQKSSDLWSGNAENPYYQPEQPAAYSHVELGSYPQTEVTKTALTPDIIGAVYDKYGDARIGNNRYRRLNVPTLLPEEKVIEKIKNYAYDSEGYYKVKGVIKYRHLTETSGTQVIDYYYRYDYKYYKYEPIRWKVLSNDGKNLILLADKGLDTKQYYSIEGEEVNWASSDLRTWLNDTFLNTAFTDREKKAISVTKVTTANSEENPEISGGPVTNDKVYLLSIEDIRNKEYGFNSNVDINSVSRLLTPTDYSVGSAANNWTTFDVPEEWWLRSPGNWVTNPVTVMSNGSLKTSGRYDIYTVGTVPVINITISALEKLTEPEKEKPAEQKPSISKTSATLKIKESVTLKVTGAKGTITWSVSDKNIISVSNGKVTAKKKGTAYVYAMIDNKIFKTKITVK